MTWTVLKLLKAATSHFGDRGCDSPRLDAELLLAEVLKLDRMGLYMAHDMPVEDSQRTAFRELTRRRARGEPVAYLLGKREFYGREFKVDPRVLIPRPETELLVDRALEAMRPRLETTRSPLRILDLGTGSGCIPITLVAELGADQICAIAVDISGDALLVAQANAQTILEDLDRTKQLEFREGDLFAALRGDDDPFDFILSNPPYITTTEMKALPKDVGDHEPHLALHSGEDPLSFHRRILENASAWSNKRTQFLFELGDQSGAELSALAGPRFEVKIHRDLAGVERTAQLKFKTEGAPECGDSA